jgi:hypothetical protein
MSTAVHITHGAQINFGDLHPYLTTGYLLTVLVSISKFVTGASSRRFSAVGEIRKYPKSYIYRK